VPQGGEMSEQKSNVVMMPVIFYAFYLFSILGIKVLTANSLIEAISFLTWYYFRLIFE
jgi:hypothetical protein